MDQRKVLIVGANSYVGGRLKDWLERDNNYTVDELDVRVYGINGFDFSRYQSIVYVAAIVHRKKTQPSFDEYQRVNALLALDVARTAKSQRVKHFIYISSMAVYGKKKKLPKGCEINEQSSLNPKCHYGKSKLAGETYVNELASDGFTVAIVRPPNIYGKNCPGNYIIGFQRMARILPFFPNVFVESKQSLLFVDNLSEILRLIIESKSGGMFCPQDTNPVCTVDLLKAISQINGNHLTFSKTLGWAVSLFQWIPLVIKIFGGISYSYSLSNHFKGKYQVFSTRQGLEHTFPKSE